MNKSISKLKEKIKKAKKAEGYFISISRMFEGEIKSSYFLRGFLKNDLYPSLEEHAKLLEVEAKTDAIAKAKGGE